MANYSYTIPNANVHGVSLKITNEGDIVNGIYSGAGVFVDNGDGNLYPLITVGKEDLTTIPANSVIYVHEQLHTPIRLRENVRVVVDSTAIPTTCKMKPVFLLEMED